MERKPEIITQSKYCLKVMKHSRENICWKPAEYILFVITRMFSELICVSEINDQKRSPKIYKDIVTHSRSKHTLV